MLRDLLEATPFLAPMGAGVALLWILGRDRDRTADQHDVSDYQPDAEERGWNRGFDTARRYPSRRDWPLVNRQDGRRRPRSGAVADLVLPPAPAGTRVPLTLYAEQVVAEQMRARYGTTNPADIAARMLREIAAEAGDVVWTSTADRDLTGAFPVVRAA